MATDQPGMSISLPAYADYHAKQYYAMYIHTDGRARLCGAAANAIGILQTNDASAQDKMCNVMVTGVSKCVYGAGVTVGANLMTDSAGKLVTATSTNPVVGVAMKTGSTGDIGEVLLDIRGPSLGVTAGPPVIPPIRIPLSMLAAAADEIVGIPINAAGTITGVTVYCEVADQLTGKAATIYLKNGANAITASDTPITSATLLAGAIIPSTIAPSGTYTAITTTDTLRVCSKTYTSDFTTSTGVIWVWVHCTA